MNWKAFIIFFVSAGLASFPQNIIGCGDSIDPYDYYISFFHQNLPDASGFKPFYYTGYNFLYDEQEPADVSDLLASEWAGYCGTAATPADAKTFINKFGRPAIYNLYNHLEKSQPATLPDSILHNSMTQYFVQHKDFEALGYILYATQVEPNVTGGSDSWEAVERDSVKMAGLIKNGQQLYDAAKTPFFKLRYGYQLTRLALYSRRYEDAIQFYDTYVAGNNTGSLLQPLSLSLKAGALFRTGNSKEAAYLFSRAFNNSVAKRVSNYLGFKWSVNHEIDRTEYLSLCKNNQEKAGMLSLFALGSTDNELPAMKEIYALDAACEQLEVLAVREINKLEEKYFTRSVQKKKGGSTFYYYWEERKTDSLFTEGGKEIKNLAGFLHDAAGNPQVKNRGLFETAAAYTAYMMKDYAPAKKYLAAADKMKMTKKLKDQWALTNLLVSINENDQIGTDFEAQLLPSLEWLQQQAKDEKNTATGFWEMGQWKKIYRDLLAEILARRYHQLGEYYKEALCVGAADIPEPSSADDTYSRGVNFMREHLASGDVEKLYALMTAKKMGIFEHFLIRHNSIRPGAVIDFAGTAYLREYDYSNAIKWFTRSSNKKIMAIGKNPFIDLLYDQEEQLPTEAKFSTTKIAFAQTMLQLSQKVNTDKANAAKYYYKIANGLYNMTYYGHAWELVEYYRSGSDGYCLPKDANAFQKEYYGCFSAKAYFEKAMLASTDKNFQARCLFMMAKCGQKQIPKPRYTDFDYNWDKMEAAQNVYWKKFMANSYFPKFEKECSGTAFYRQAYNSCSFLRDFVEKKKR